LPHTAKTGHDRFPPEAPEGELPVILEAERLTNDECGCSDYNHLEMIFAEGAASDAATAGAAA
jgi:hypothetical protein